jgi:hypothetical protein
MHIAHTQDAFFYMKTRFLIKVVQNLFSFNVALDHVFIEHVVSEQTLNSLRMEYISVLRGPDPGTFGGRKQRFCCIRTKFNQSSQDFEVEQYRLYYISLTMIRRSSNTIRCTFSTTSCSQYSTAQGVPHLSNHLTWHDHG